MKIHSEEYHIARVAFAVILLIGGILGSIGYIFWAGEILGLKVLIPYGLSIIIVAAVLLFLGEE